MAELLLELLSEEIPARLQTQAAQQLRHLVTDALVAKGLSYEEAIACATPRRLALHIVGLPIAQPDQIEERKGPRVDAPAAAIAGFLKSSGLKSIDEAHIFSDAKKGDFYVARHHCPGHKASKIIAEILPKILQNFPWPKSMRWGKSSAMPEAPRWIRPLRSIVCTFGIEQEFHEIIDFSFGGLTTSDLTQGHRFMAPKNFSVRRFDDYVTKLQDAKVVLDGHRRAEIIRTDAANLAFAQGLSLVEDVALLEEVTGLIEWPVVLMGTFDENFLSMPPEIIRATIRANQKCFVLTYLASGRLANKFILVANVDAKDGGKLIVAGNEKVVKARLSDAKFFYETDLGVSIGQRLKLLAKMTFQERLGSQLARAERIQRLAIYVASFIDADTAEAARAGLIAKTDLVSGMVGEFPELQGIMGAYYAQMQGENPNVARAVGEHYRPQGPSDQIPSTSCGRAVAIADKLDNLAGFWAIAEIPTSSKDPFALRRAALGIIRIVLESEIKIPMRRLISFAFEPFSSLVDTQRKSTVEEELYAFLIDRFKIYCRENGARHDYIEAVIDQQANDDLLAFSRRINVLNELLDNPEGKNLLRGYKRASNILKTEEKKSPAKGLDIDFDESLLQQEQEKALVGALIEIRMTSQGHLVADDYAAALQALSYLRDPLDDFFETVTVNDSDPTIRVNRLRILTQVRLAIDAIANFSKVGGNSNR